MIAASSVIIYCSNNDRYDIKGLLVLASSVGGIHSALLTLGLSPALKALWGGTANVAGVQLLPILVRDNCAKYKNL